jgi:glycosyltransferase 2 family protein
MQGTADRHAEVATGGSWLGAAVRWVGTVAFLAAVFYFVDVGEVASRLVELEARWLAAAVALSVPLHLLIGLRWAFTARRVGAPLTFGRATAEYYLAIFVSQVLPVGFAGPAAAAVRHHERLARAGEAVGLGVCIRAIILDRVSSLLAFSIWMAACAIAWLTRGESWVAPIGFGLAAIWAIVGVAAAFLGRRSGDGVLVRFSRDGKRALVAEGALGFHLVVSTAAIGCIVGMFYCAGRAVGVELDFVTVLQVVPLILGSTALPLGFAGWGVREATAAALYGLLALGAEAGVAVSVTFGLISLVTSAPGLAVLLAPAAGRVARRPTGPRLLYASWFIAGAVASILLGHPAYVAMAGVVAMAVSVVRGRRAWTPDGSFGAANAVTALRVVLTAMLWLIFELSSPALFVSALVLVFALDGLDGYLARRRGSSSPFGAHFDMASDAYLVLVLCVLLATHDIVGMWVLVGGLLHYVYELAVAIVPARGVVPRSKFGRAAYFILVTSLIVPFLAPAAASWVAATGAICVSLSYVHSFFWTYVARLEDGADSADDA